MMGLQLRSLVKGNGELVLSLAPVETPKPGPADVLVRIEAAPLNPSDLGLLFGPADMSTAVASGTAAAPVVTAKIPPAALANVAGRVDMPLPVGNEGAGVVVAAGNAAAAQALLYRRVAVLGGGGMYAQYRCLAADQCLPLPEGVTAVEGAAAFINPLTALGMVATMRREGHSALVHTAAASNLGQMLLRVCQKDDIPLINIVRKPEQEALLRSLGAQYVYNMHAPDFRAGLTDALAATGATLAFDAIGGGPLAGQILGCMEAAISRTATVYSRYGSTVKKQVYIYGSLDPRPVEIVRNFGASWGVGGWLLTPFLQQLGPAAVQALKARVAAELTTTFASRYAGELSLAEALQLDNIARYRQPATGGKYLILPNKL